MCTRLPYVVKLNNCYHNGYRGQLLNCLMKQCEQGVIQGIHGRLGDLGTIDEKYDVAISTACGALDHIVVDTMQTAVKCVEYLKKHNLGSATFIALDKVLTKGFP